MAGWVVLAFQIFTKNVMVHYYITPCFKHKVIVKQLLDKAKDQKIRVNKQ